MSVRLDTRERAPARGDSGPDLLSVDDLGDSDSLNLYLVDPQGYGVLLEAEKVFEHLAACPLSVADCHAANTVVCDPDCARDGNWRLDARRLPASAARFHATEPQFVLVAHVMPRREVVCWGDIEVTPANLARLREVQRRGLEAVTFAAFANTREGARG